MPLTSADDKDALIWAYNSQVVKRGAAHTNVLYAYCHLSALGMGGDPNARTKMLPARGMLGLVDGFHILVLLSRPIRAICTENGSMILFSAAILREYQDGTVEGWLINSHAAALATWASDYPEAQAP
jgi:hypothetical protein